MNKLKLSLKNLLSEDVDACINQFLEEITANSHLFDEMVELKNRFTRLEIDSRKGLITENEADVRQNQIVNQALYLINKITPEDCQNAAAHADSNDTQVIELELFGLKEKEKALLKRLDELQIVPSHNPSLRNVEIELAMCQAQIRKWMN